MATKRPLRFGVKTAPQHTTFDDILRIFEEADAAPALEHGWVFDHFMPLGGNSDGPCLEGWTLLAALAARTERLRVGVMVTGNTYRHPAVLANMGATVDQISHGRLDFGIGAGWHEQEHAMYGIPLYAPAERIHRLDEACEVIRLLWTEPVANFAGRYYQLTDARSEPRPVQMPHPPIVIGGSGERLTLRVVAKHADIWNFANEPFEEFVRKSAILDGYCAEINRNPEEIERSVQVFADPDDLAGSRETVRAFIGAGATHLILNLRAPYPEGIVRRLADEIATSLLDEYEQAHA
jgi:F420-dependent oxidoreductase-like protein